MKVERKYKLQYVTSKDPTREILASLHVVKEHKGITGPAIAATDGWRLVVVPCELEPDDVPGIIRGDALKLADADCCGQDSQFSGSGRNRRTRAVKAKSASIKLGEDRITTEATASYPRFHKDGKKNINPGVYPNSSQIVPYKTATPITLTFNPTYLLEMVMAMGGKGDVVTIEAKNNLEPMLVKINDEPAFGILMPRRTGG